jgi:uncharacterized protein (TIGR01244 family)
MKTFLQIEASLRLSAQPEGADLLQHKQQGVRTVIDFRMPSETAGSNRALVEASGLNYVNIPVDKNALSPNSIARLDAQFRLDEGPYLLHCATGTRAAVMLALQRGGIEGWSLPITLQAIQKMGVDVSNSKEFLDFIHQITES